MSFNVDSAIRPQDDLFRYVNGPWLANTKMPEDKSRYGAFTQLRDEAELAVKEIVLGCNGEPGSIAAKIRNLYDSFMDEAKIEALGLTPLTEILEKITAISTLEELIKFFAYASYLGITIPFAGYIDADPGQPDVYRFSIYQDGLGLPDQEYYFGAQHQEIREKYLSHIQKILSLAGLPDSSAEIFALEKEIASHHWDKVKCRDMVAGYNPTAVTELPKYLQDFLKEAEVHEETIILTQPSFVTELTQVLENTPIKVWQNYLRWHTISDFASALPKAYVEANFDFYAKTLSGTEKIRDRWKRGVAVVQSNLGEAVGQIYVEKHFSATAKERMDEMIEKLIEAYRNSISQLTWMTEKTRKEALTKLSKFRPKIGYPERWKDYSDLEINAGDLIGNLIRSAIFATKQEIAKLGKPIQTWEWLMTPQTVNAYYHPLRNEIVFPAAILQPPFFDENADDAVNYGAIGAVIGHEIGHGFDDQGSTCDGDGRLRDWWQPKDREAFKALTGKLVEQYNNLIPADCPDLHVNGEFTLGENIGDLGGLGIAYQAWLLATKDQELTDIDGYTPEQRFFMSWAKAWQMIIRPKALREQITTDPHSPDEFRCNQVVRNIDAFYQAFDVKENDALWLDPKDRVTIW